MSRGSPTDPLWAPSGEGPAHTPQAPDAGLRVSSTMGESRASGAALTPGGPLGCSLPIQPPLVRDLTELIDPDNLPSDGRFVQSPSGNFLGRDDFSAREDRPLSLRERQERIRQQLHGRTSYAVSGIPPRPPRPVTYSPGDFALFEIPEYLPSPGPPQEPTANKSNKAKKPNETRKRPLGKIFKYKAKKLFKKGGKLLCF